MFREYFLRYVLREPFSILFVQEYHIDGAYVRIYGQLARKPITKVNNGHYMFTNKTSEFQIVVSYVDNRNTWPTVHCQMLAFQKEGSPFSAFVPLKKCVYVLLCELYLTNRKLGFVILKNSLPVAENDEWRNHNFGLLVITAIS